VPYSSPRPPGVRPRLLVPHTAEGILNREDLRRFLDNNPNASAHAISDAGGLLADLVPDERAAWTAGPTGNSVGLHIEQCAFVAMSREQWLSEADVNVWVPWIGKTGEWRLIRSPKSMLRNTAKWLRTKSDKWGIPLVKLSPADVRAGKAGVCGHGDISRAWEETNHTDPEPNYPWDVVLTLARGGAEVEEDDEDMVTVYVKGDKANAIYCCSFSGRVAVRRWVDGSELAIVRASGVKEVVVPQANLDAIPILAGSR
jgi:hypothetical protein